jgi:aminotransferase
VKTATGFVAQKMAAVPPSGIRRFFDIINSMPDCISLGVGEPDFVTPEHIREAAIEAIRAGKTKYSSNAGMLELRIALSEHLERLYGVKYDPEKEIIITVGVSEALQDALIACAQAGDEVIVAEPCFVSYKPAIVFAGAQPVVVCTYLDNDFQVTGADIRAAITDRTKAILIGYPNNPTGAVMDRARLLEIGKLAEERDLLVFSDEIYDRLVYGIEHTCFASLPRMRDRTVLLGGFSKAYAMTGWRVGYVAAPQEIISAIYRVHQYAIMCAPTMSQYAALQALKDGEDDVQRMRAEYDRRRRVIVDGFNSLGFETFEPRGAFYCFPKIEIPGLSTEEFCEKLLFESKVAVVPGGAFGECGAGHVRACYATAPDQIETALERIGSFVRKHK